MKDLSSKNFLEVNFFSIDKDFNFLLERLTFFILSLSEKIASHGEANTC